MDAPREQTPGIARAVAGSELSLMAWVAVHAQEAGDPDGAADGREPLERHAAIGFIAGIAPGHVGGDRVSASLQAGFAVRGGRFRFAGRTRWAVCNSNPRRSGSSRVSLSGLGEVPGFVRTRRLTAADSPWSLQRIGRRLSAGLVYRF
jgi:hypothetical protein